MKLDLINMGKKFISFVVNKVVWFLKLYFLLIYIWNV